MKRASLVGFVAALFLLGGAPRELRAQDAEALALADRVFANFANPKGPGCAVGVSRGPQRLLAKGYGSSNLEAGTLNSAETIFEAGSVSKQFTAAAVIMLALDGRIRLDEPVRKYFPELPEYQRPITIRMLLDHTSGLRDWGAVVALAGWPRGTKTYTHADVLEILTRQKATNYPPGDAYSYTNSGYNLLAMLVARVTGRPFATFTQERIFAPLGMTHTSWRDEYRRIVPGRAQAYAALGATSSWQLDMPFEQVHGNGGLLTTVGDLLIWNEALRTRQLGGALVDSLERRGVLTSGEQITYAAGLVVQEWRGTKEIGHSGATAGYRAYVARYPQQGDLSVAVLCNVGSAAPGPLARQMAAGLSTGLADATPTPAPTPRPAATWKPTAAELAALVGDYRSEDAEVTLSVVLEDERLIMKRRPATSVRLTPTTTDHFTGPGIDLFFTRDAAGTPVLHSRSDRAWDVPFTRVR